MAFFDLNIPIEDEQKDKNKAKITKDTRVKLVVKAMELGYSGIAFNRSISGVMSDSDRCTIAPLPLSSLLEASPALAETVRFHREVLGVPVGETFKQYTRLTVVVESMLQAAAISPINPVLKGYDLVAVRPMDQQTFEHACNHLKVDLISIDFSQRLTLRFKRAIVKAAMERGIFFEIMYSPAISNFRARREMFASTKVLINCTCGRNIIVSSAASRVNELRGPIDVANMSTLFGLSMEHARAAVSKNCRAAILHGSRKKYYKSAIQVENHSPDGILGSDKAWFNVSEVWDPISSGDGDLVLKTNQPVLKTNLVENGQPIDKKGPTSRAKKRRRASSSQRTGVLVPDDNKRMGLNTRTSTCGFQLKDASLHTGTMATQNTNVTISDADTHIIELKSRMQNIHIPQATPYGVNKFNFSDAVEFLALDGDRHQLVANGITWATEYESCADQGVTQQSSIVNGKADIDPVNGTGLTTPGLSFNGDKGPSVTVVRTDALQACKENSFVSDNTTGLVDIRNDDICNSNTQIKLPESKSHDSIIESMREQGILVLGSGIKVDGIELRENRKLITEPHILQGDFISNDALMDTTMSTMGAEELTAVCSNGASEMELDCETGTAAKHNTSVTISDVDICMEELKSRLQKNNICQATPYGDSKFNFSNGMEFLVCDDNGQQLVPRGITQVSEYNSITDQQVTQQSSVVNCDADIDTVNGTGMTPSSPSFNGDKGPLVNVVQTHALRLCNENSLPSDDITGVVDIGSDDLCTSNTQIKLPESKINNNMIGNMMEQVNLVSGSVVKVDGLDSSKRLITEPNKHQGDFIFDDATMVAKERTAVCSNGASEMELNCKTGTEGKLQRKKLPRVDFLSFRSMLKSAFFKKRVLPRKRNSRK